MATIYADDIDASSIEFRIVQCGVIAVSTVIFFNLWPCLFGRQSKKDRKWDKTMVELREKEVGLKILRRALWRAKDCFPNFDAAKVVPMKHQVGGHPMLSYESRYVLKPLNSDSRGFREVLFYEVVAEVLDENSDMLSSSDVSIMGYPTVALNVSLLRALKPFFPQYHGILDKRASTTESFSPNVDVPIPSHIILSDITSEYAKPCVLDVKIGQRTYEPDAPLEKQESQHNKYPEQVSHGFRIVGMRIYDPNHSDSDHNGYRTFDKKFGTTLKGAEDIQNALSTFFKLNSTSYRRYEMYLQNVIADLMELRRIQTERNRGMAFYASSLLVVLEGCEGSFSPDKYAVKMIDFSHVRFNSDGDASYVYGLSSLLGMLNRIRVTP